MLQDGPAGAEGGPLTVSAVARALKISESTVRKLADSGRLPVVRVAATGLRLFRREDVEHLRLVMRQES